MDEGVKDTAKCWTGDEVWCPTCGGPTNKLNDEYGSLAEGGSFEKFKCRNARCPQLTIYVELPD